MKVTLNFSSLNVKDFKANHIFFKYLSDTSNISFFHELWLKPSEINLIKNIFPQKNKTVLFKSDMTAAYTKGRPFGGQCWVFDKYFKISENEFLSKHLSYLILKYEQFEFAIIGTHMPFDDSNNRDNSKSMFELTLSLISVLIEKFRDRQIPFFIAGDLNADIFRKNRFDKLLSEFANEHDLFFLDHLNTQKVDFTYSSFNSHSSIDHIIAPIDDMATRFIDFQCNVVDDVVNLSDHRNLSVEFSFESSIIHTNTPDPPPPASINFDNPLILNFFSSNFEKKINEIFDSFEKPRNAECNQDFINKHYNAICNSFSDTFNETLSFQAVTEPIINKKSKNINNNKKWFTSELLLIRNRIRELHRIKTPIAAAEKSELKSRFRKIQRQNIYFQETKELSLLETVAREKNKNKFWRFIKKNRKKRSIEKNVSIEPDKLLDHYRNFFFDDQSSLSDAQLLIKDEVKTTYDNYSPPSNIPFFKLRHLEDIIKELKSSEVKGFDSITYNLIKRAGSEKLNHCLLSFFNNLLIYNCVPDDFNVSIIKPIIKDQNKNAGDINNIRPISISNCLSQIFEKLILFSSPELHKIHKNQFGFKKKTSCNHALFVMKEAILNYTQNGTGCKIASLDAEKAFDKVWRDGLFFKLLGKLELSHWIILKKYYDLSKGTITLSDFSLSELIIINCGVKQGGILSPFLFNVYINDLIAECIDARVGALLANLNVSILVYADDILLISPIDSHMRILLDICSNYGNLWRIKFNPLKSNIIEFGKQRFPDNEFILNSLTLPKTNKIEYLGVEIDNNLDFDLGSINKFKNVRKSIFSLSFLGLKPLGISPTLQSFLYKTFCLSQFTYALETTTLKKKTRDYLGVCQNNLIRQIIGLKKFCHISKILDALKIFNFEKLYIKSKLSFLASIKFNELSSNIYDYLVSQKTTIKKSSKSFLRDIITLEEYFKMDISLIFENKNIRKLTHSLKDDFKKEDGVTDSIRTCLSNFKVESYRIMLDDLTKPEFIKEDEEFQLLLQYFIITES